MLLSNLTPPPNTQNKKPPPPYTVSLEPPLPAHPSKQELEDDWPKSIFPQVLIQPRRHLFTSLRRACLRAAMLNVYGHMRAPSHRPTKGNMAVLDPTYLYTSVKTRRVKLVKLETNYKQKEKQSIANLTRRPQFLQSTLAQLSSVQDGSAQLGSVKVGSMQATFREWLCATGSVQVGSARVCSAQCALHELRRAISHESGLRKLHCSRLLRASKLLSASCCTQVLCASCSAQVLWASCSAQVLCASCALRMCSVQVGLCKLLCASICASALCKLLCASAAGAVGMYFAYYFCT